MAARVSGRPREDLVLLRPACGSSTFFVGLSGSGSAVRPVVAMVTLGAGPFADQLRLSNKATVTQRKNTMQIVTSLSFKGQCRQAFEFYAAALGGEITAAHPYGDGPPGMPTKPEYKDWLMHCWLKV